jgi:tetratricopeptide (TPR) repeat protein
MINDQMALQDVTLIVLGFRSVAADLAWIQLLQYFGGAQIFDLKEEARDYRSLKPLTQSVMRLDPTFVRAVSFGAVSLAWLKIVQRPEEAIELLKEGIEYNPTYWPFQSYLVSMGYQAQDQFENMLAALGDTLRHPDCPIVVKAIVANTFKLHKKYREAYFIWENIFRSTDDPAYKNRALQQMQELQPRL